MEEQKIKYETAKLAKEKEFDVWCDEQYINEEIVPTNTMSNNHVFAPTQSQLQKWLREEHDIYVIPNIKWHSFEFEIVDKKNHRKINTEDFLSWEEALEKGLQEALKLI